jgi:hypothetical protein
VARVSREKIEFAVPGPGRVLKSVLSRRAAARAAMTEAAFSAAG